MAHSEPRVQGICASCGKWFSWSWRPRRSMPAYCESCWKAQALLKIIELAEQTPHGREP